MAVHGHAPIQFELEVKTDDSDFRNMALEALPLVGHMVLSQYLKVRCLYVYRGKHSGGDRSFWTDNAPPVRDLYIPDRWDKPEMKDMGEFFKKILPPFFPSARAVLGARVAGSADPFVLVDHSVVLGLPGYKDLVNRLLFAGVST